VLAPGPFYVDQGGVAAVGQVLAGEQAPALQPGVDPRSTGCCDRYRTGHQDQLLVASEHR
jgi:hypothetical protein